MSITNEQGKNLLLDQMRLGREVCNYQLGGVRRAIHQFKSWGFPIEIMTCTDIKCINNRKHVSYYYEWAKEHRTESNLRHIRYNVAIAPIMIESEKIDILIDELIDEKLRALELKKDQMDLEDDSMFVSECCQRIVYGTPNEECPYCVGS